MPAPKKSTSVVKNTLKSTPEPVFAFKSIRKRDGSVVAFNPQKIENAIMRAMSSVGMENKDKARAYSELVVADLKQAVKKGEDPSVEQVQDLVEKVLIEAGEVRLAREYIKYRAYRASLREEKQTILEKDSVDEVDKSFTVNALKVLKSRYLGKDEKGKLIESPKELFTRVAVHAALPSLLYDKRFYDKHGRQKPHKFQAFDHWKYDGELAIGYFPLNRWNMKAFKKMYDDQNNLGRMKLSWSEVVKMIDKGECDDFEPKVQAFYDLMVKKEFLPNTPAIANFGRSLNMGSACFVLDVEDSIGGIMKTLTRASSIFKSGGGVGYNFSKLRPEGDIVSSTSGIASGPISFMTLYDKMTDVIKQGGIRRGANMGILNSNHPDIEKFVTAKAGNKALRNFNISVLLMPDFWEAYEKNKPYALLNPRNGKPERYINARSLFDMIVFQAWESAEPGVIFYDKVNEHNPLLKALGPIVTTNPCGEVLLYPNESCNLGSVNVHACIEINGKEVTFNWQKLERIVTLASEFLDNIIDINSFPLPEIEEMTKSTRKIGLGLMGLADALFALRIPYDAKEGLEFMEKIMQAINWHSKVASVEMARTRGPFPLFSKSSFVEKKFPFAGFYEKKRWDFAWDELAKTAAKDGIRNAYTTVIAPTGSISMIAGTSSGIEPVFALVYQKNVAVGSFYYIDEEFEKAMKEYDIYDESLMKDIVEHHGSLQRIPYLPPKIKKVFKVAHDLDPESHVEVLGTFQRWTDSSISKTINFPADATVEDMRKAYLLAYKLGCKDVTVYRDSSIKDQVLNTAGSAGASNGNGAVNTSAPPPKAVDVAKAAEDVPRTKNLTDCPKCKTKLIQGEGCVSCPGCGWGLCS